MKMTETKTILCNWHPHRWTHKPTNNDLQYTIQQTELITPRPIKIDKLAELLTGGGNCRAGAVRGRQKKNWVSHELIMIDIDNEDDHKQPLPPEQRTTPQIALKLASGYNLKPCFIYHTWSDSPQLEKFRVAFLLDEPITDLGILKQVQEVFKSIYTYRVDKKCWNEDRIFYGTSPQKPIYEDYMAENKISDILKLYDVLPRYDPKPTRTSTKKQTDKGKAEAPPPTDNPELIKAIRSFDVEKVKNIIFKGAEPPPKTFDNYKDFFNFVYKLDMSQLLQTKPQTKIHCLFHTDRVPSADVRQNEKFGNWNYHCFGCGKSVGIINLIAVISGRGRGEAIEFIKRLYNLDVMRDEAHENYIAYVVDMLERKDNEGFYAKYPETAKNVSNCIDILKTLIMLDRQHVYTETTLTSKQKFFSASQKEIARLSGTKNASPDKNARKIDKLAFHKLITKLPDSEIPQRILYMSNKSATENNADKDPDKLKHSQFFAINWDDEDGIKERGILWQDNKLTNKSISYEGFYRVNPDIAYEVYPQHATIRKQGRQPKQRTTTARQDNRHDKLMDITIDLINTQGYATEAQIIARARGRWSKAEREAQLKKSLPEIITANNLVKIKTNKEIKAKYNVDSKGYPNIIVKNDF